MRQDGSNVYENGIFANIPEGIRPGGMVLTQRLVDYCDFQHGAKTVDIGCGTGTTVKYLRDIRGLYAVGIDVSALLLERGKERTGDLPLIQSSGEQLPFGDHSIDGVLAECSLSVMPSISRVLTEANRILIPGGKLAITDLYARGAESCDCVQCNSSGIMTYREISQVLLKHGFEIMVFEDQSRSLTEFVASFIMEHGGAEELWQCTGLEKMNYKIQQLGYYLLIAEKCV